MKLKISNRAVEGKRSCRQVRESGRCPAVLYGKSSDNIHFSFESRDFNFGMVGAIMELKSDSESIKAIIQDMQFHPVTDEIAHVDFMRVDQSMPIEVKVRCKFIDLGASTGLKYGGTLNALVKKVRLKALPALMPRILEVSVAGLGIGDCIKAAQLLIPKDVHLVKTRPETVIVNIIGRKSASAVVETQSSASTQ